jgi:hypothetical protein
MNQIEHHLLLCTCKYRFIQIDRSLFRPTDLAIAPPHSQNSLSFTKLNQNLDPIYFKSGQHIRMMTIKIKNIQ